MYAEFTVRQYDPAITILFDGYEEGPNIKDSTHLRRGHSIHPVVSFTAETEFSGKKDEFLSRDINKQRLIWFVTDDLRKKGCTVVNAVEDADVDKVKTAVNASLLHTATLIKEDTDLLVLLLYYVKPDCKCLYFRSHKFRGDSCKVYNIKRLQEILGNFTCSQRLFIHTMT